MQAVGGRKTERPAEFHAGMQHDRDLVQDLINRLNTLWHFGECFADAEGDAEAQKAWRDLERREVESIKQLKLQIYQRIEEGEFLQGI